MERGGRQGTRRKDRERSGKTVEKDEESVFEKGKKGVTDRQGLQG